MHSSRQNPVTSSLQRLMTSMPNRRPLKDALRGWPQLQTMQVLIEWGFRRIIVCTLHSTHLTARSSVNENGDFGVRDVGQARKGSPAFGDNAAPRSGRVLYEIPYSNLLSEKVVIKETPLEMVEKEARESDKRPRYQVDFLSLTSELSSSFPCHAALIYRYLDNSVRRAQFDALITLTILQ